MNLNINEIPNGQVFYGEYAGKKGFWKKFRLRWPIEGDLFGMVFLSGNPNLGLGSCLYGGDPGREYPLNTVHSYTPVELSLEGEEE